MDAQAGLNYVKAHPFLAKSPIVSTTCFCLRCFSLTDSDVFAQILYGQSIGGAVSIDLASRNPLLVCLFTLTLPCTHHSRH